MNASETVSEPRSYRSFFGQPKNEHHRIFSRGQTKFGHRQARVLYVALVVSEVEVVESQMPVPPTFLRALPESEVGHPCLDPAPPPVPPALALDVLPPFVRRSLPIFLLPM